MVGIALICALLHSDGSVTNSRQLGWHGGIYGGTTGYGSTMTAGSKGGPNGIAAPCPARHAMTGIAGNAGRALDHRSFTCHPIQ